MKNTLAHNVFVALSTLVAVYALGGCVATSHPVVHSTLGRPSSSAEMERLIDLPGPIELNTVASADWVAPLSGLLNLNSETAKKANLIDRQEPIQVYAHVLRHPQRGVYLVDTGVSQKLVDNPSKVGLNWLILKAIPIKDMKIRKSTAEMLNDVDGKLAGVFFTHLHIDHISGMPDIPGSVPLYIGPSETGEKSIVNLIVGGPTNELLEGKQLLQEWPFQSDPEQQFEGVVDIFGDGSVFAISAPGHTAGSVAYLVRTSHGPVLLTGDTCHTRWGWENTVEPGDFTRDASRNLINLKRLKALVARHPSIDVRLGHQP